LVSYFCLSLALLFSTVGQLLIKVGAKRVQYEVGLGTFIRSLFILPLVFGASCVICAPLFYFAALQNIKLGLAYGFMGLNFVFVMLASGLILKEKLHSFHFIGAIFIFVGVVFIGA